MWSAGSTGSAITGGTHRPLPLATPEQRYVPPQSDDRVSSPQRATCSVAGCERWIEGRGMCRTHYRAVLRSERTG